ncbi:MAG TPA: hypothetical protein IGS52_11550 [Oscillatoriaceae cyanobacterium M33_DOE_052]|uniref:Uncharacterized protein n=1 Tax=Planktothricoides sp. SpSt-374 TaxID=2282167 RepID=A0A7C3VQN8_9CYAN|nr:hypothetical protein [Oscillatoriaceae cyanobacterium M33_DOE_052]
MRKFETGEVLISSTGRSYRVVDSTPEVISLLRIDGYTLFSCHPHFIETSFSPATAQQIP